MDNKKNVVLIKMDEEDLKHVKEGQKTVDELNEQRLEIDKRAKKCFNEFWEYFYQKYEILNEKKNNALFINRAEGVIEENHMSENLKSFLRKIL